MPRKNMLRILGGVLCLVVMGSGLAEAVTFDGQTIRITHELPAVGSVFTGPLDVVVGAGVEATNFVGIYNIDLSDTNISMTFPNSCCGGFGGAAFNGTHFFDLNGTIGDILSVTIASDNIGFTAARITFDANNIFLDLQGLNPDISTGLLSLDVVAEAVSASVPEPSSWLLLTTGIGIVAAFRRQGFGGHGVTRK